MGAFGKTGLACLVFGICLPTAAVLAGGEIEIGGEVRYRGIADDRDFDQDTEARQFGELRTRVGLQAKPQEDLLLYVQLQDSRILGENSGSLRNDTNLGLHQGYFLYDLGHMFSLQAGRFEMAYGNQRLVGTVGWHNVGRTWDGMRLTRECEPRRLDLFWVKRNESFLMVDDAGEPLFDSDDDQDFMGLNLRFKQKNAELFVFVDSDRTPRSTAMLSGERLPYEVDRDNVLVTFGAHSSRVFGQGFDYVFNGAFQLGSNEWRVPPDTTVPGPHSPELYDESVKAYLVSLELGHTFAASTEPRLAVMIDYASGDDDLKDDNTHAFNNLYYTGHKFRGYMDYFVASNPYGLFDVAVRFGMRLSPKWKVRLDVHRFKAAAKYPIDDDNTESAVGRELDLVVDYKDDRFGWQTGLSFFDADEEAAAYDGAFAGPDNAVWAYSMFTARF